MVPLPVPRVGYSCTVSLTGEIGDLLNGFLKGTETLSLGHFQLGFASEKSSTGPQNLEENLDRVLKEKRHLRWPCLLETMLS